MMLGRMVGRSMRVATRGKHTGVKTEFIEGDLGGQIAVLTLDRPDVRNAVDGPTALSLHSLFSSLDADPATRAIVLTGQGPTFCAGADLHALNNPLVHPITGKVTTLQSIVAPPSSSTSTLPQPEGDTSVGPMGPTRLEMGTPVVAAVNGYAVAGGMELAAWADLRVASSSAGFGVLCRRWGVPLIDGGTFRIPRAVGASVGSDLILTGRIMGAEEAAHNGFVNVLVDHENDTLPRAIELALQLTRFPHSCMVSDLLSSKRTAFGSLQSALAIEYDLGLASIASSSLSDVSSFQSGSGRGGTPI